jgi:hypothetical protein
VRVADDGASVEDVVSEIKAAIKEANVSEANAERDLKVTAFGLDLKTVATTKGGLNFEFKIPFIGMTLKGGAAITNEDTNSITMTLVPPELLEASVDRAPVQDSLVSAIQTVRQAVRAAAIGDDPFKLKEATVELSFVLTRDGNVNLGIEGEKKGEVTHTLRLVLGSAKSLAKANVVLPTLPETFLERIANQA